MWMMSAAFHVFGRSFSIADYWIESKHNKKVKKKNDVLSTPLISIEEEKKPHAAWT